MRSNVTVGPPIELLIYRSDSLDGGNHMAFEEDDEYLWGLRDAWQQNLKQAFLDLPRLPSPKGKVRLLDVPGNR